MTFITFITIWNYYISFDVSLLFLWFLFFVSTLPNKSVGNIYHLHFFFCTHYSLLLSLLNTVSSKQKQGYFPLGGILWWNPGFILISQHLISVRYCPSLMCCLTIFFRFLLYSKPIHIFPLIFYPWFQRTTSGFFQIYWLILLFVDAWCIMV